jgi:hypothetical protein
MYLFAPLQELVPVYSKPFTLKQVVTPGAAALKGKDALTLTGRLDYQACDDRVCFKPVSIPFRFELKVRKGPWPFAVCRSPFFVVGSSRTTDIGELKTSIESGGRGVAPRPPSAAAQRRLDASYIEAAPPPIAAPINAPFLPPTMAPTPAPDAADPPMISAVFVFVRSGRTSSSPRYTTVSSGCDVRYTGAGSVRRAVRGAWVRTTVAGAGVLLTNIARGCCAAGTT